MTSNLTIAFFIVAGVIGCSPEKKDDNSIVSSDINELNRLINLSIRPTEVTWSASTPQVQNSSRMVPGPTDFTLVAVLTFDQSAIDKFKRKIVTQPAINESVYLDQKFIKDWFPGSITGSFYPEGQYSRIKPAVYPAKTFYKSPYLNGFCFFTDDNKMLVCLYTTN